jgi:putative regulator of septum formation
LLISSACRSSRSSSGGSGSRNPGQENRVSQKTKADRDSSSAIVGEGSVNAFQIRVGDCFNDSSSLEEVSSLPGVPCSEPHDNETFAVIDLTVATYPEGDAMAELAYGSCMERFEAFVGTDYESSSLDILTMSPTSEGWKQNDREVICAVYNVDSSKLVGGVEGLAL